MMTCGQELSRVQGELWISMKEEKWYVSWIACCLQLWLGGNSHARARDLQKTREVRLWCDILVSELEEGRSGKQ